MTDPLAETLKSLLLASADPGRAFPNARAAITRTISRTPIWAHYLIAASLLASVAGAVALTFDLRLAHGSDLRLAEGVRRSGADIASLASDEIAGRLAVQPNQGRLVWQLVNAQAMDATWITRLIGSSSPLAINPGRLTALSEFLARLSQFPAAARAAAFDRLMETDRILRNPQAAETYQIVASLPPPVWQAITSGGRAAEVLSQIANLDDDRRDSLLIFGLSNLPAEGSRLALLPLIAKLPENHYAVLKTWLASEDTITHESPFTLLSDLEKPDRGLWALISAYYYRDKRIKDLIPALISYCYSSERRSCP